MDLAVFGKYRASKRAKTKRRLAERLLVDNMPLVTLLTAQLCGWQESRPADGARRRKSLPVLPGASVLSRDEAIQCGRIGFTRALQSFDPAKGKIAYYAALWIRVFLQQAIRAHPDSPRAGATFVDIDEQVLGKDESAPIEASLESSSRIRRVVARMTREQRAAFQVLAEHDYDPRRAARDMGTTAAAVDATWALIRRWLVIPTFADEVEDVRRFIAAACVLGPSARVSGEELRRAYAAHVGREISVRRVGLVFARLARELGLRQIETHTLATDGERERASRVSVRMWVGIRLRAAADRRVA